MSAKVKAEATAILAAEYEQATEEATTRAEQEAESGRRQRAAARKVAGDELRLGGTSSARSSGDELLEMERAGAGRASGRAGGRRDASRGSERVAGPQQPERVGCLTRCFER